MGRCRRPSTFCKEMDFDTIRPVISGLVGAAIAGWLAVKWAGRLPYANSRAKQNELAGRHKKVVRMANVGFGIGLMTGLIIYLGGLMDSRDWRGLGWMMGLSGSLPLLVILLGGIGGGWQQVRSGFAAYSVAQKVPVAILLPVMACMTIGGFWIAFAASPKPKAEQAVPTNGP